MSSSVEKRRALSQTTKYKGTQLGWMLKQLTVRTLSQVKGLGWTLETFQFIGAPAANLLPMSVRQQNIVAGNLESARDRNLLT